MNDFSVLGQHHRNRRSGISLTPLIDVVFILLLFFMLTSTFIRFNSVALTPARVAEGAPVEASQEPLLVRVLSGDRFLFEDREIVFPSMQFSAVVEHLSSTAGPVLVVAGEDAAVQDLIAGIEVLTREGLERLDLIPTTAAGTWATTAGGER